MDGMTMAEYQREAGTFASPPEQWELGAVDADILRAAMGMTSEAGELMNGLKKVMFQGHELDRHRLVHETGDVLWYVAYMATALGVTLEELALANLVKLAQRYPQKFARRASVDRQEEIIDD